MGKIFQYSDVSNDWEQLGNNKKFVGKVASSNYGGSVHLYSTTNNNGKIIKLAIGADHFGGDIGYVEMYQYYSDNNNISSKWEQIGKFVGDVSDGKQCIVGIPEKKKKKNKKKKDNKKNKKKKKSKSKKTKSNKPTKK